MLNSLVLRRGLAAARVVLGIFKILPMNTVKLLLEIIAYWKVLVSIANKYCLLQDAALLPSNTHYAVEHCKRLAAK